MHAGIHLGLRVTARVTFVFFTLAFAGEAAARLWPGAATEWVARQRDPWLVAVAVSHSVHLGFIVALVWAVGFGFLHTGVVGWIVGGSLFALIYLVAAGAVVRRGPLYASGFRTTVLWVLWAIFALAFLGGLSRSLVYLPLAATVLAALGVRLAARLARMRVVPS